MTYEEDGWKLKKEGKYLEALNAFDKAVSRNERVYFALHGKGECLLALGRVDDALNCFSQAIRVDRSHPWAYHGCGRCYLEKNKYEASKEAFRKSLRRNDASAIAWLGLGKAYVAQSRLKDAEKPLRKALNLAVPRHPDLVTEINSLLETCKGSQDISDEIGRLKEALQNAKAENDDLKQLIRRLKQENMRLKSDAEALENVLRRPIHNIHAGGNVNIGGTQANDNGVADASSFSDDV